MNESSLVRELLALNHQARVRRLVEVGRQSRTAPDVAALLSQWAQGDWQQQQNALLACWGSRDSLHPSQLAGGPSRSLAKLAIALLAVLGDDDQIVGVLHALPHKRQARLLSNLRRRRRPAPINTFVAQLQARGAREAFLYQALSTDGTVAADGSAPLDVTSWRRRALTQPEDVANELSRALLALSQRPDGLLFQISHAALQELAVSRPDLAVNVLHSLRRHLPLDRLPLKLLLRRCPTEVADLVLSSPVPVSLDFSRVVKLLGVERLLALLKRQPNTLPNPAAWLGDLKPASRAELFRQSAAAWRYEDGSLPGALVGLLPAELRHAEARRHLELPTLATLPQSLAAYCAFLPWEEARARLRNWFQHPEAEMRASAWQALTTAARYHPGRLGELLTRVRERKYEQDPVRLVFLIGLANLPPSRWTAAHLPDLAGAIREALDATDLSPASTSALANLLWRLLPKQPTWAVGQLALLFRERGPVFFLSLEHQLTDEDARRVEEALAPVCATWKATNRDGWLLWMAHCLGCRLRACPRLIQRLRDLLKGPVVAAIPALELLRQHLPRTEFEALLAKLLRRDPGWITVDHVFAHLYAHRQDLLHKFLSQTYLSVPRSSWLSTIIPFLRRLLGQSLLVGLLGKRDLIHFLPINGQSRLTAPQQQVLAKTLAGIATLPPGTELPRDAWALLLAIDRLSRLPAVAHDRLVELAQDKRLVVRDAALRGLGRLDSGEGLPTLLEALGDDRARVAIYAVRTALSDLPGERVLAMLKTVPMQKVTVAKEVLRLAGELGGEASLAWLQELAGQSLHPDVRIALLRALWDHLESPAAWTILNEAAMAPDGRLLTGVLRIPADRLSAFARQRLIDLLSGLLQRPEPTVRLAVLERFAQMPVPDPSRRLLEQSIPLLSSRFQDERLAAAQAILALIIPEDDSVLSSALRRLLPQRQHLVDWLTVFTPGIQSHPERVSPVARALLEVLRTDPLLLSWQAALAVALDGVAGFRATLERALVSGSLHADDLAVLRRVIEGLAHRPDLTELEQLEADLAASSDERLRRLAVTALSAAAQRQGWTALQRARLERYRADTAPLVAGAAQFLFPPVE